jgi:hypothetical protein
MKKKLGSKVPLCSVVGTYVVHSTYNTLANFCLDPPSPSRSEYKRNNQNHLFCLSASSPQKIYTMYSAVAIDCYQTVYLAFYSYLSQDNLVCIVDRKIFESSDMSHLI